MNSAPLTVLLPVYNGEKYVADAVESILNQSYSEFELLIIDDGSTDDSYKIISAYSDPRIRILKNEENRGLIYSLNRGIKEAKGKFVARLDADDYALPVRLELQMSFMNENPEVALCSTGFIVDNGTSKREVTYKSRHNEIKFDFLNQCHICHGSAVWNNDLLKKNNLFFNPEFSHAEDFDLFARIMEMFPVHNLPEKLSVIRKHSENVSRVFSETQLINSLVVRTRMFKNLGMEVTKDELMRFEKLYYQDYESLKREADQIQGFLEKMNEANHRTNWLDSKFMFRKLSDHWFHYCYNTKQKKQYQKSYLKGTSFKNRVKMTLKG